MASRIMMAVCSVVIVGFLAPFGAMADEKDRTDKNKSAYGDLFRDIKSGKVKIEGDHAAVTTLVLKRDIPITYDYIATLMRTPNAFGAGPACIVCHGSADPQKSYRGLDLSSCEGILKGATEEPARPIVLPGKAKSSLVRRMIRNNRMPLGVSFAYPTDTAAINDIRDWINAGAKNDDAFKKKVLPSLKKAGAFGSDQTCVDCHMSNEEPPSFHELDLTSHAGIMKGADSILNAKDGKPPTPVVIPGKANESPLYQRLVENRMPPGIDPSEDRDHPNTQLLLRWIDQGGKCN
jgi:hypothetical protein